MTRARDVADHGYQLSGELVAEFDLAGRTLNGVDALVLDTPGGFDYRMTLSGLAGQYANQDNELQINIIDALGEVSTNYSESLIYMRDDFGDNYPRSNYVSDTPSYWISSVNNLAGFPGHVDLCYMVDRTDRAGFKGEFHGWDGTRYAQYLHSGYNFHRNQPILQTRVWQTDAFTYESGILQLYKYPRLT